MKKKKNENHFDHQNILDLERHDGDNLVKDPFHDDGIDDVVVVVVVGVVGVVVALFVGSILSHLLGCDFSLF